MYYYWVCDIYRCNNNITKIRTKKWEGIELYRADVSVSHWDKLT